MQSFFQFGLVIKRCTWTGDLVESTFAGRLIMEGLIGLRAVEELICLCIFLVAVAVSVHSIPVSD
jgi:hypothetical protein